MKWNTYRKYNPNVTYAVMNPKQITTAQKKDLDVRTGSFTEVPAHCSEAEKKLYLRKYPEYRITWKRKKAKAGTITMPLYKSILYLIPSPGSRTEKGSVKGNKDDQR